MIPIPPLPDKQIQGMLANEQTSIVIVKGRRIIINIKIFFTFISFLTIKNRR